MKIRFIKLFTIFIVLILMGCSKENPIEPSSQEDELSLKKLGYQYQGTLTIASPYLYRSSYSLSADNGDVAIVRLNLTNTNVDYIKIYINGQLCGQSLSYQNRFDIWIDMDRSNFFIVEVKYPNGTPFMMECGTWTLTTDLITGS